MTNAKRVNSATRMEMAPLPRARAGFESPLAKETNFEELARTHVVTWYRAINFPIQPRPCSALST